MLSRSLAVHCTLSVWDCTAHWHRRIVRLGDTVRLYCSLGAWDYTALCLCMSALRTGSAVLQCPLVVCSLAAWDSTAHLQCGTTLLNGTVGLHCS